MGIQYFVDPCELLRACTFPTRSEYFRLPVGPLFSCALTSPCAWWFSARRCCDVCVRLAEQYLPDSPIVFTPDGCLPIVWTLLMFIADDSESKNPSVLVDTKLLEH